MHLLPCLSPARRAGSWLLALLVAMAAVGMTGQIAAARATTTPICATASGYLLLQPRSTAGAPKAGLIVVDPATGKQSGRISVPAIDAAFPTPLPGRALAIAGDKLFLVDAEAQDATAIDLDGSAAGLTPNPVQFRGTAGTRYLLLGSPSFDRVVLVDASRALATSLTALIAPPAPDATVFIQYAAVTPDDAHVVLWDSRHIYLVDTDDPTAARQIDPGAFAFAPAFSPDGGELVYSTSDGPGSGSTLVREPIAGGRAEPLRESAGAQVTLWVPRSRTIFIDERSETGAAAGTVSLFDLDHGVTTELTRYIGSLTTVQLSPDGRHALLGVEQAGVATWFAADLEQATVESLPSLGTGKAYPGLYANARWALFLPLGTDASGPPAKGPAFRGVDLDTGEVGRLLEMESPWQFTQPPTLTANGRYALVIGQTDTRQKIWLLDAKQIQATVLAEAEAASAIFSPDGCSVALTKQVSIDGLPVSTTLILPISGETGRDAGRGTAAVWVS